MPSDDGEGRDGSVPRGVGRLSLSVVGPVSVKVDGKIVPIAGRKARAVLAYLALTEGLRESRERLVGLLWSEFSEEKARTSLRQTLHELRAHLKPTDFSGLHTDRLTIWLDRATISVDLWDIFDHVEARRMEPLLIDKLALTDQLLQDLDDIDPAFRVWVLAKRRSIHDRLTSLLTDGLRDATIAAPDRRRIAAALLGLDSTHEEACRALMRFYAEQGDAAAALRTYNALWEVLEADYDMEPSLATQQLVADIKQGLFDTAFSQPAPAGSGFRENLGESLSPARQETTRQETTKPSPLMRVALTVERYDLNGIEPDRLHLVHGFRHNLIASLVRFREWLVADGDTLPTPDLAGGRVAATYSVSATAYQAGSAIHLVMMLRDRANGVFVWSGAFEVRLDRWFEVQQGIIRRIAVSLNIHLSNDRLTRLTGLEGQRAVYDQWLRGQEIINSFSPEHWDRAAHICDEMMAQAPTFSPAFSTLVQMNNSVHIIHPGLRRDASRAARTLELARKSVQLDPVDSRAQLCLGWSLAMSKQYRPATVHVDLAIDLNPNDPWSLVSGALFNAFLGQHDRATELWNLALDATLAPRRIDWGYRASIAFLNGDYEAAIEATDHAADVIKTLPAWRAAALYHLGRQAEAEAEAQRFLVGIRANWYGAEPATDAAIGEWLLHLYPIAQPGAWELLRAGVAGAGLSPGAMRHHGW